MAEDGAVVAGADVALELGVGAASGELAAFDDDAALIFAEQADQLFATAGIGAIAALQRALADEAIVAFAFDYPAHAQVLRRYRAVGVLADDDEAFFSAQDVQSFGAVGRYVVFSAKLHDALPEREGVVRLDVDLVAKLAREADAHDAHLLTEERGRAPVHEGEGLGAEVDSRARTELLHKLAAFRADDGDGAPVVGYRV